MHFSQLLHTMAGRHLLFAYGAVFAIQGGYLAWTAREWLRLRGSVRQISAR